MAEAGRLERSLVAAVTLADSKDDAPAALKVLESAMAADPAAPDRVWVRAWILRADRAIRMGEVDVARRALAAARSIQLNARDGTAIVDDLERARALDEVLEGR